jgi:uncharacterized protein (TIRG00374 family)
VVSRLPTVPKWTFKAIRIAFGLAVLVLLVIKVGHAKPLERLAAAKPLFIILGVVVVIIDGLVRVWNWTQLIRAMHLAPEVPYSRVVSISWAGGFLGQVVPSTAGTDAIRAMIAARTIGGPVSAHAAAIVMLNALSLVVGCTTGVACALWLTAQGDGHGVRLLALANFVGAIAVATTCYWLLRSQRGLLLRVLRRMHGPWRKLRRPIRRFAHKMLVFERFHVNLAPIVAVAFLTLITRATVYAMVGLAVGVVLPFPAWLALVPAYTLSGLIPYSVSGYGGDQAAIVYMLTGFGASASGALVFALIVPIMAMTYNMIGGLPILFGRIDTRARLPASY